jgi:hypothetical protein
MPANDALLGLLQPAFQVLIAGLLLIITILGLRRLAQRGPARMTNAVVVTGLLIVTFTVARSRSAAPGRASAERTAKIPPLKLVRRRADAVPHWRHA